MNHCFNCRHFIPGIYDENNGFCMLNPRSSRELDDDSVMLNWVVSGKGYLPSPQLYGYARTYRLSFMPCSTSGKLFEPKPPTPLLSIRQKLHKTIGKLLRV